MCELQISQSLNYLTRKSYFKYGRAIVPIKYSTKNKVIYFTLQSEFSGFSNKIFLVIN